MIEWIEYDPTDRSIESHVNHLITNGKAVQVAQHAKIVGRAGYAWFVGQQRLAEQVTHWAKINLPGEVSRDVPNDN